MTDDKQIAEETWAMLERDSRVPHPGEIALLARTGTVTLRGTVGSFEQRRAAARSPTPCRAFATWRISSE